jgi:hypothetical protein
MSLRLLPPYLIKTSKVIYNLMSQLVELFAPNLPLYIGNSEMTVSDHKFACLMHIYVVQDRPERQTLMDLAL